MSARHLYRAPSAHYPQYSIHTCLLMLLVATPTGSLSSTFEVPIPGVPRRCQPLRATCLNGHVLSPQQIIHIAHLMRHVLSLTACRWAWSSGRRPSRSHPPARQHATSATSSPLEWPDGQLQCTAPPFHYSG